MFSLFISATMLALDSSHVIALRLSRIACGGMEAADETQLMVSEKVRAGAEAMETLIFRRDHGGRGCSVSGARQRKHPTPVPSIRLRATLPVSWYSRGIVRYKPGLLTRRNRSTTLREGAYTGERELDDRRTLLRWKGRIQGHELESFDIIEEK